MFNRFLQNTRKPAGILGRMMLRGMNAGHAPLAKWGFSHLRPADYPHILDVGCGGGANIAHMLKEAPNSRVDGLDYSEESVAFSKKRTAAHWESDARSARAMLPTCPTPTTASTWSPLLRRSISGLRRIALSPKYTAR